MIQLQQFGIKCLCFAILFNLSLYANSQTRLTKYIKDSLALVINKLYLDDQKYRWIVMLGEENPYKLDSLKDLNQQDLNKRIIAAMENKAGLLQEKKDSIWRKQLIIDTTNTILLKNIINKYGYPDFYKEPIEISTILLHSPYLFLDSAFFEKLKRGGVSKKIGAYDYALIYDKICLKKGNPERYFVIEHYDSITNQTHIQKPIDLELTNKARKEIGLKKLQRRDLE